MSDKGQHEVAQTGQFRTALGRLMKPRSIAVVGASAEPGTIGFTTVANLDRFGFTGDVHLVSRRTATIGQRPCVASIEALPSGVDAAILIVPAAFVPDAIASCIARGIGGVVIFASGFSEQDEAGRQAQDAFASVAVKAGLAVLGPNCIGSVNFADSVPLTFEPVEPRAPKAPGVCVLAQSGAMAGNIRYALMGRGVPVTHSISTGNEAVIAAEDFIDLFIDDPAVGVFALFMEQIRRPQAFLDLAARARRAGKPIVLLHPGRGARAREAALTHTGALAGDHAVMRTFVEREAVVWVEGLDELFDVTTLLAHKPRPMGGGAAMVSNSGALRGFSLDFCEGLDLTLPQPSPAAAAALKEILPSFATVDNPLDVTAAAMTKPGMFGDSAQAMLADPEIGFLLVAVVGGGHPQQMAKWRSVRPVLDATEKSVLLTYIGDDYPLSPEFVSEMRDSGLPFFRSVERGLRAMARVNTYARRRLAADALRPTPPVLPAMTIEGQGPLAEWRSKAVLARCGIAMPPSVLARDLDDARAAARRIGYPVVLKAQADALAHKSEVGGVIVDIADEAALDAAYARLLANIRAAAPSVQLDGILVEAMAKPGGLEMIVGARRDPQWGPTLLVGLGGIWTEALHDVRLMPADTSADAIVRELSRLKGATLLSGSRGMPARDVDAVASVAATIGALMIAHPQIVEIDVNPLLVYAKGEGALALDALIMTQG